eukprot:scaffold2458_cov121-Isochrysis_galbana.AAC.12
MARAHPTQPRALQRPRATLRPLPSAELIHPHRSRTCAVHGAWYAAASFRPAAAAVTPAAAALRAKQVRAGARAQTSPNSAYYTASRHSAQPDTCPHR